MAKAAVQKSSKINFYKFVNVKEPPSDLEKKDPGEYATTVSLNKSTEAINNLGATINGMAGIVADLKKVELERLEDLNKNKPKMDPKYGKTKKGSIMGSVAKGILKKGGGFLEGLLGLLGNLFKGLIILPALSWLSKEENQSKVVKIIEVIGAIGKFIWDWAKFGITQTIDGLYMLLSDDTSWWEKTIGFGKAIIGIGSLFLGLRWLTNPVKLAKDITTAARTLVRILTKRSGSNMPGTRGSGWKKLAVGVGATIVSTVAVNQLTKSSGDSGDGANPGEGDDKKEGKAKGGIVKGYSKGGWIQGPQSGYPVSLDGGKSTAFIGHGTEYVSMKSAGGQAFVTPYDTPATRKNPGLTAMRQAEAKRLGYAEGGEVTRQEGWDKFTEWGKEKGAKYPQLVSAQWALESGWGSALSAKNNFFGIKATSGESSANQKTREVVNGKDIYINANFKNFETPQDAVEHLVTQWYKDYKGYKGVNNAGSPNEAAAMLKSEGYATDPTYPQKLIELMQKKGVSSGPAYISGGSTGRTDSGARTRDQEGEQGNTGLFGGLANKFLSAIKGIGLFDAGGETDKSGKPKDPKMLERLKKSQQGMKKGIKMMASGGELDKLDFAKGASKGPGTPGGMCVAGVIYTGEANNAKIGDPEVSGGIDPGNHPRGLMAWAIKKGYGSIPDTKGRKRNIKGAFGNFGVTSMTESQWGDAVVEGKIPSGALIFNTRKGWDWNGGSSGNDAAIAQSGGSWLWSGHEQSSFMYKGKQVGAVYSDVKEIVALTHPQGNTKAHDGLTSHPDDNSASPGSPSGNTSSSSSSSTVKLINTMGLGKPSSSKSIEARMGAGVSSQFGSASSGTGALTQATADRNESRKQFKEGVTNAVTAAATTVRSSNAATANAVNQAQEGLAGASGGGGGGSTSVNSLPGVGTVNMNGVLKSTAYALNSNNNFMRGLLR